MLRLSAAALALTLLAAPAAFAQPADASVTLTFETGARSGRVMVALYDSEASYTSGSPVATAAVDASGSVVAVFDNLPAGDYAMKSFHDVNGDGQMNTNPFGMPTEPYAFSNNAVGNMGPASWDRARFTVSGDTAQTISIR
ncbi:DUF2141 domain-containing protein [Brevundimonas lenta]|uniref:Uncharacterized protein (DUF2141 family) n=1 Tax=Brevundimonas lenta TaxID=424796 RepID=A0A7W6JFU0_9CAUL|nr:DUF2141 domain-containing protein [Brevundimonas lenta]MBB4084374.1 uncharacterized protein (DUF2141 family) [Brevundimonas lenta]